MQFNTRFPMTISIDDQTFSLIVTELSPENKAKIEARRESYKAVEAVEKKVDELRADIAYNEALAPCVSLVERAKLLWETKALTKELRDLEPKISAFDLNKELDTLFKMRLDFTVEGVDKEAFLKTVEEKNIDKKELIERIGKQVLELKKQESPA